MTLNVNKEKLTILDVQFDNYEDFDAVWYAVGSSMIEDFTPTTESVLELKNYVTNIDNFYTYENSFVLINKQNILDPNLAKNNEHLYVSKRLADLYMLPIPVYSMTDILKLHKYLFQDVYSWAGQYRKVNITKSGNPFMSIQSFSSAENFINDLLNTYHQKTNTKESIIKNLAKILDCLNFFHPFREGNGRTQRKGYKAQIRVSEDDTVYNTYMDGTVHGDLQKLELLFEKILEKI